MGWGYPVFRENEIPEGEKLVLKFGLFRQILNPLIRDVPERSDAADGAKNIEKIATTTTGAPNSAEDQPPHNTEDILQNKQINDADSTNKNEQNIQSEETENTDIAYRPNPETVKSLVMVMRYYGVPADPGQIQHKYGKGHVYLEPHDLVRAARGHDLRSKLISSGWARLASTQLPCLFEQDDGSWAILGKVSENGALVQLPGEAKPRPMTRTQFENAWTGRLILVASRSASTGETKKFDWAWFVPAIYRHRGMFAEVLIASLFVQMFALAAPLVNQVVFDKVLTHNGLSTLEVMAIAFLAITIFEVLLTGLRGYVFSHTAQRIDVELGARLYRHMIHLPMGFLAARRIGDVVARVRELETIRNFITGSGLTLLIDLLFVFVFVGVMMHASLFLTLIVLGSLPFYLLISLGLAPVLQRRSDEKFKRSAESQSFLVESIGGVETAKAMAVEPQLETRWEEQLAATARSNFRLVVLNNWSTQGSQLISKLVTVACLYFGAVEVLSGNMTMGQLVAFNMLSGRVSGPILGLARLWQDFQQVRVSLDRLGDILNSPTESQQSSGRAHLPPLSGEIKFDNVEFRYRQDQAPILRGFSVSLEAGKMVALVGPSGSGKSTIARLIQRLYIPDQGHVLIDGVDLAMADVTWLRRQIGVVSQEAMLFSRSVRENIALADPSAPMERVVAAAKLAGAHEFILKLPEGYDTVLAEGGKSLSGGQRQRIAIARALIHRPRLLILDEATSALDVDSEVEISRNLKKIAEGRTVLVIAHRLSTVRDADRILVIDGGKIIEDGTPQTLIARGGVYARMWQSQVGQSAQVGQTAQVGQSAQMGQTSGGQPLEQTRLPANPNLAEGS